MGLPTGMTGLPDLMVEQAFELSDASAERSAAACTVRLSEAPIIEYMRSNITLPMYQTLPCLSCAYQSKVRSTAFPCSETVSRTTVHLTPRIIFVRWVTIMSSFCGVLPAKPA